MTSEQKEKDIAYAMNPYKLISWPVGMWPLQDYNFYSLIRCILGGSYASLILMVPCMELYMTRGHIDTIEQSTDSLMLMLCGIIGMSKIIIFRRNANIFIKIYKSAVNDYLTIDNAKERAIMRKHAYIGRLVFFPVLAFSYIYVFNNMVKCLLHASMVYDETNQNITNKDIFLEYPMPSRHIIEYFHAKSMYKTFIVIESIIVALSCNSNVGNDFLFLNITLHICGQIKILRAKFTNFDVTLPKVYDRFNALIERQNYLIKMTRELAELISFILLVQFSFTSLLICVMGFQVIFALKVNNTVMVLKSLMVVNALLTQCTMFCFIGNYLKSEMEDIGSSVYLSAWYKLPSKLTKNIIFILMQTKCPVSYQAGNFIAVNIATCVSILKTSFSYLSVLRIMIKV
ncbi:Odorant receptor 183 [Nylanderia fulva]|uniref:Odorant receptor n=1 Tax=Nylanderia fulva TaxID=613905 RepID=A0A6G1LPS0_9HYME|nr:Odorant receptor 183 [Nylanderia fulva]